MNTINCLLKLNEYHIGSGKNITPAEALILRYMHDPSAHKFSAQSATTAPEEQKQFWSIIQHPTVGGEAVTLYPDPAHDDEDTEPPMLSRPRTDAEELARLRGKYNVRGKANQPGTHLIDDLFPGIRPNLPQSFEEIGIINIGPTPPKKSTKRKVEPVVTAEPAEEVPVRKARGPRAVKPEPVAVEV